MSLRKVFEWTIVPKSFKETIVLKACEGKMVPKVDSKFLCWVFR